MIRVTLEDGKTLDIEHHVGPDGTPAGGRFRVGTTFWRPFIAMSALRVGNQIQVIQQSELITPAIKDIEEV